MCNLTIAYRKSFNSIARICNVIEGSAFYISSIRVLPTRWEPKEDLHLSLGGGSRRELDALLIQLHKLPGVLSTQPMMPAVCGPPAIFRGVVGISGRRLRNGSKA
jgi:acetolactate synthase regulatory subunit